MEINTQLIEQYIKNNNISKAEFCKRCNISSQTLRQILSNERTNMTYSIINIADILNVEINDLLLK